MDFQQAKRIFADYLKRYDTEDDKIRLKIVHTYGVVSAAEELAAGLGLSAEDADLARHIALLHDIGRFEQLRLYHSFDDSLHPHAQCSLDLLFGRGMIRDFLPEREYDSLLQTAIRNHGAYRMEPGLSGRELLHSQLIRDADKLDNFRVKAESSMVTMTGVSEEELGSEEITDSIYQDFMSGRPVLNSDRKTHMDMWVSYLGYLFDLNFPESLSYVDRHGYVDRLVDRVPYSSERTKRRMELIRQKASKYVKAQGRTGQDQ